ncbi:MAG: flagellar assembly protein FliH [Nitrosospira sp.]|nr:flagellar assembly protein FliH [Nitrosospira sp.]
MTNRIISKESSRAYRRWEMNAFEQLPTLPASKSGLENQNGEDEAAPVDASVGLPTVQDIEHMYKQAQDEGYAAGYAAGQEAGTKAGYEAGREQVASEAAKFQDMFRNFQQSLADADQTIGNNLLILALGLSEQMIRGALRVKPELVCAVVRECIQCEPGFNQPAQLFLHPEDAALVREHLNHELNDCEISIDSRLERGGCRIRMGNSHVDATMATRWKRVAQALGQNGDWLE